MTLRQALDILNQVSAQVPLTRPQQAQVLQALELLKRHLDSLEESQKPEEVKTEKSS